MPERIGFNCSKCTLETLFGFYWSRSCPDSHKEHHNGQLIQTSCTNPCAWDFRARLAQMHLTKTCWRRFDCRNSIDSCFQGLQAIFDWNVNLLASAPAYPLCTAATEKMKLTQKVLLIRHKYQGDEGSVCPCPRSSAQWKRSVIERFVRQAVSRCEVTMVKKRKSCANFY